MIYNWQQKEWPDFTYDLRDVEKTLYAFAQETGHVSGLLKAMPETMQMEIVIDTIVAEAIKTSAIGGEYISRQDVMSSVRNNFGLNRKPVKVNDRKAAGAAQLMIAIRESYAQPLTEAQLLEWHRMLLGEHANINTGAWRKGSEPMQVVSGGIGKEKIHYEAPPSSRVPKEMKAFIKWFNDTAPGGKREISNAPVRSAIAHLYFESIHPFEDGNGRIGRALSEKALSQTLGRPVLLSLSQTIEANRKAYYSALEKAQRSNEISPWIKYFVETVNTAQLQAGALVGYILQKAKFFDTHRAHLNDRQLKAINKMLDEGTSGFEGGMSAKKYMSITGTSKATATRDLQNLAETGAVLVVGEGRSTRYLLNLG